MKKLLAFSLIISGICSAHADPVAKVQRMTDVNFNPEISVLEGGNFQYFYSLSDADFAHSTLKNNPDDPGNKNLSSGNKEVSSLDSEKAFLTDWNTRSADNYHVMILKWSTIVNKNVAFLKQHFQDASFQTAIHTKMAYSLKSQNENQLDFKISGSLPMPDEDCHIGIYDRDQARASTEEGIEDNLKLDASLGLPDLVVTEHYSNFGKVLGSKTSRVGYAMMKIYADPTNNQNSIIVNYTMSYLYKLPPKIFFGGPDAIRAEGIELVQKSMQRIDSLPND